ncbi:MAG: MG(2+) CHELATASE FAMILY PROTEIN / ComM-related protein [uncultured Sphingomonas sp.]|uniref:MG(2+) CHELATASE FAMILY PROTEIN / ComM-related protein n=1 Tax=uncultured Sphingomonas sp. TaxID=158754 RepID=A0A6J4SHZ4_9SPHN|nr:MAG: MG(2+) CHELATASE FAMILY PROTEIN / ComM-related protein [uncultured Sphingomonas sp.]
MLALLAHLKGTRLLPAPAAAEAEPPEVGPNLVQVKGQEVAKRALEIAAAGGHNLLMSGPPRSGKSLLAACLPGILPPLQPSEALEVSMVAVAGELNGGRIRRRRPFRAPHHSASMPALVGGGLRVRPGEISLAHLGVLFLDELPEFQRAVLDSLRQPLETGSVSVARANTHVTFPAGVQLIAAMNPCRCGHLGGPALACSRALRCAADYQARVSGPLLDRIDLHVEVPSVSAADLTLPPPAEGSGEVAERVAGEGLPGRALQWLRCADQCGSRRRAARPGGHARRSGAQAARRCRRSHALVGLRLPPGGSRRAHHRRSCRSRRARPHPRRRGAQLPAASAAQLATASAIRPFTDAAELADENGSLSA